MERVLQGLIGTACLVYLDDVVVFGVDQEAHDEHLRLLLGRLREYQLSAKPSKCRFSQESLKVLGYMVSKNGILADPQKVEAS